MDAAVRLRSAVALLGRFPALAGVDLEVASGEIVHLVGPNGAGKTTLLRVLAGLVPVESGEATVLGHPLATERRLVRARVGFLATETFLYDDLTVAENVHFWARAAGADAADASGALQRLGLTGRLRDLQAVKLSTGQRRRVSFAALVARRPELWLLDEPHGGLDQGGRNVVDTVIGDAVGAGATVILASHELDRARTLGAREVHLAGGVVQPGATRVS